MLAVSPLIDTNDERQREMESFSSIGTEDFTDFTGSNLLDSIYFDDDLFVGINDGDVLPDLEMDPEILAEFSLSSGGEESEMSHNTSSSGVAKPDDDIIITNNSTNSTMKAEEVDCKASDSDDLGSSLSSNHSEDNFGREPGHHQQQLSVKGAEKEKKTSSSSSKNAAHQGKRKVKVDWTPELHRRFVQAVEQLGLDKAVPSRILELMGIDCLTRHNIASHLQKYRSHRKHLLAREAEAASWNQRRQLYGAAAPNGVKRDHHMNPWVAPPPTMGFPPVAPMPPHFRPLHVWGHPSVDQSLMHGWPKHIITPSPSPPPPSWPPHPPPADPSFWHHQRRFPGPPVPGIPPPRSSMYKVDPGGGVGSVVAAAHPLPQPLREPPLDLQPSKESVDAALGDVLSKPWLPLPLGLRPPSVDGVLVELQRQGVPNIPPTNLDCQKTGMEIQP